MKYFECLEFIKVKLHGDTNIECYMFYIYIAKNKIIEMRHIVKLLAMIGVVIMIDVMTKGNDNHDGYADDDKLSGLAHGDDDDDEEIMIMMTI